VIIDTSAVVAVLRNEPEREQFAEAIAGAGRRSMAAPNLLETAMVLAGRQEDAILERLDAFLREASIRIQPFSADHAAAARHAFLRYGKGRHKAALNFGDCIAYAAAKLEAEPLLFKGEDFRLTDIEAAT
jgi:ribonuclease VapC